MRESLWFCGEGAQPKLSTWRGKSRYSPVRWPYSAADGPERDHPLDAIGVAAAVGLKARVVSLLQDKLLAAETGVLVAHPAGNTKQKDVHPGHASVCWGAANGEGRLPEYVRAAFNLQGADVLHPTLHDVLAAGGELHTPALEVLLIVHSDLQSMQQRSAAVISSHVRMFTAPWAYGSRCVAHIQPTLTFQGPMGRGLVRAILSCFPGVPVRKYINCEDE